MTFRCPRRKDTVSTTSRPVGREVVCFYRAVSVGTQWETRGKNRRQGLGKKGFPQKKVLSLVLCVAMLLSVMVMGTGAASFTDQDEFSDNYAEAAEVLTGMGIIQGYDDGSFLPQRNINRAQVATMIYRAATGDVTDSKISQFVGEDLFDDVNADDWFAGYVNYCGNAEYIKGFTPDTFGPYKQVTGYQVLAMILRAVGYDENDEYTGDQWTLRVAATAREQGLLDNLNPDTNLAEPATRELVAQLIFEAIQIDTVRYSPAAGAYRPSTTPASSLGEQVFDLAVVNDNDVWGRPATIWYAESSTYWNGAVKNDGYQSDKDDLYATIEEEALATYTTAVKICDVADDLGIAEETFTTYTNGEVNDGTVKIDADATTATIGAQGRLTEVYEDTIVYIDTFLARVDKVTEVKYDADGHVAKDASLTLGVYANNGTNHNDAQSVTLTDDTNYTYAEGDMLLVNAVTDGADWHDAIATDGDKHVEFVGAAESFVGAQTYIQWNDNQHTVDGDVYNDALHFHLDVAGLNGDINYNWYLDQYDNLIGVTAIDRTNYAVLKDMTWTSGQAEATLLYMNGEEATVVVNSIDGDGLDHDWDWGAFWNPASDDATPEMAASSTGFFGDDARVSHDDVYNDVYDGFALYQVYTNDDGSVNLEGFEDNNGTLDYNDLIINYANLATLDVNGSEIWSRGQRVAYVDGSTQIIVNNGDGTYSAYTGTDALADFANRSIEVFWSVEGDFTDAVYIKSAVAQAATGEHLFATTATYGHIVGNWEGVNYYTMNVYVDGTERTIVTNANIRDLLLDNPGKLFHVRWDQWPIEWGSTVLPNYTYGYVTDVQLVNDQTDGDLNTDRNCNYLSGDIALGTTAIIDRDTGISYNLSSATQVIYNGSTTYTIDNLQDAIDADMGIWVVDADDNVTNNATAIYVGTKLSEDTTISVTANNADADKVSNTENWQVWLEGKGDKTDITIKPTSDFALYTINNGALTRGDTATPYTDQDALADDGISKTPDVYNVTVYNEAGTKSDTHSVTVTGWDKITGAVTEVTYYTHEKLDGAKDVYYSYADAVENIGKTVSAATQNSINVFVDSGKIYVPANAKVVYFTAPGSVADADASVFNTAASLTVNSGDFFSVPFNVNDTGYGVDVVLQFTPQGGEAPVYVAYHVNDIGK